jgi:hypothetical protein
VSGTGDLPAESRGPASTFGSTQPPTEDVTVDAMAFPPQTHDDEPTGATLAASACAVFDPSAPSPA